MGQLAFKRVVLTRPPEQMQALAQGIIDLGGEVLEYPLVYLKPLEGNALGPLAKVLDDSKTEFSYDALVLTSASGARLFAKRWPKRVASFLRIFVVGRKTAEALQRTAPVLTAEAIHIGQGQGGEDLAHEIIDHYGQAITEQKFLFAGAKDPRPQLRETLLAMRATVDELPLYETVEWTDAPPLPNYLHLDWLIFMSPSAVRAFAASNPGRERLRIACIGPSTAEEALRHGFTVDIVSPKPTVQALLAAMDGG